MRTAVVLLAFVVNPVFAQYNGPAVEACRAYAKSEAAREGTRAKDIVFERDQNLQIERYTRKLKKQFECRCGTKKCRGTMLAPKR